MSLAFAAGALDKHIIAEPLGLRQHGRGDFDQIVEGEDVNDLRRSLGNGSEASGKQRFRRTLDVTNQAIKNVIEERDLLVGIVDRVVQEKVGDALQCLDSPRDCAMGENGLEFLEQICRPRRLGNHGSVLEVLQRRSDRADPGLLPRQYTAESSDRGQYIFKWPVDE